jgi:hypothetical protein
MADTINVQSTSAKNILNTYRSYNYIFTLAALKDDALADPESLRQNQDYFVIARSGGKGTTGIQIPSGGTDNADLVNSFNANSSGRFDFFINNVQIETIMGADEKTSLSVATKIEFDLFEPYSMSGFIEALQVSAVASGHAQYVDCPYLLKMEFIGYPDNQDLPEPEPVPNSTRYFVFGFTGLEIDVTQEGARYKCKCVPFNEKGYGEPAALKSNIQLQGNNVADILQSFQEGLNKSMQSDAKALRDSANATKCDQYEIVLPKVDETGIIKDSVDDSWKQCKVIELLKSPAVYAFTDPGIAKNTSTTTVRYDPTKSVISFAENANINECIISIIRDSEYTTNILKEFPNNVDKYGMVPYFMVHLEVEKISPPDVSTNKPFYKYRYVVIPYKIHYTRIPLTLNKTVDTDALVTTINRKYDYMYTGANTDIKTFQLKFNSLFFQAIPPALGDKKGTPVAAEALQPENLICPALISKPTSDSQNSSLGVQPIRAYPDFTAVNPKGIANSGQPQIDPYAAMAKNMHQAVLENVDQCQADIEIIGDPYYLVTGSMGNYRPPTNPDNTAGEGEAPYTTGDVMIIITFRNPSDVDLSSAGVETGLAIFDQTTAPYSGAFRVLQVMSKFNDGQFTQSLKLIRIPAQLIDTNKPVEQQTSLVNTTEDPANMSTDVPPDPVSTLVTDPNNLLASLTSGLPISGLPGSLSQLVSSAATSLSGALSPAAGALSWNSTLASAGASIAGGATLASTALASGLGSASSIGASAMAAVTGAGSSAAGLISGVGSKVSALTGGTSALTNAVSAASGLSTNLTSKAAGQATSLFNSVPAGVDLNSAINSGLILNNIPKSALANLPATQPLVTAPLPAASLTDIKAILDRGGSIANIPGAASIPGVSSLLASSGINLPSATGLNAASIAGKLSTVQSGMGSITGQSLSVEASIGSISSVVPTGLPNVSGVSSSVVNKFGSVSANAASPLSTLMKSVTV